MSFANRLLLAATALAILAIAAGPARAQQYLGATLTPYAVLGGSTVTCTGASTVTGNVGVSPGTAITGFPSPCTDVGALLVPPASDPGQAALGTAFGVLAARTCDATIGPDLQGLRLTQGTYCVTAAPSNLTGLLLLDAQGNPSASWVFKMTTTLITSPGSEVRVINGGNPCAVQWSVNTSATIDVGTIFVGNILAGANIALNPGATLTGRALAQSAAVNLSGNNVSFAACGAGGGPLGAPGPFPIFGATPGVPGGQIPTLSEWMMIVLAALLAIAGMHAMGRKR